jgi:hypothetical protein
VADVVGFFDSAADPDGWFQHDAPPEGWFSSDILSVGAGGSVNYSLSALAGSYSLTGGSAVLTKTGGAIAYSLTGNAGSYSLTGGAASLKVGRKITALAGTYSLTGGAANLKVGRKITALAGSYSLTGGSAVLTKASGATAYSLTANPGSYAITGSSASLVWSGEQVAGYSAEINLKPWYVKRGKKIHVFSRAEDADAFIEAEQAAQEAIEKAQNTSRQARRRAKKRVYEAVAHETVDIDLLGQLAQRYAINADIPALIQQQDWMQIVALSLLAQQMQDEEDIEMLLLA